MDELDHSIAVDNDDYDEESMLARVLLESQSSFLLEQQRIYQHITTIGTTDIDIDQCSYAGCFKDDDCNEEITGSSLSQWYDYRHYNNSREFRSVQGGTKGTGSAHASIQNDVIDGDDDENATTGGDLFEEEPPSSARDDVEDSYDYEQFHSFRKSHSRRPHCRSIRHEPNNYIKMPSQSSIFTNSTCAETITTTSTIFRSEEHEVEQHREEQESDYASPSLSRSPSVISDDMVIQEQIRILRTIQEQQLLRENHDHPSMSHPSDNVKLFNHSATPIIKHDDDCNYNENTEHTPSSDESVTPSDRTTLMMNPSYYETVAQYHNDFIVPYPDGTTTIRVHGVPSNVHTTVRTGCMDHDSTRLGEGDGVSHTIHVDDDNVITTQCTYCTTLSQVVRSTSQFLFCVQCQEISPIVPIRHGDVLDILLQQQQQQQQQQLIFKSNNIEM